MILLKNVLIWTKRPISSSEGTSVPIAYLSAIEAYAGPVPQSDYQTGTPSILESDYLIKIEIGTDIKKGDTISTITRNDPPVYTPWDELGAYETLLVNFARDSAVGVLQHRRIYCKRITAGGPSQ